MRLMKVWLLFALALVMTGGTARAPRARTAPSPAVSSTHRTTAVAGRDGDVESPNLQGSAPP